MRLIDADVLVRWLETNKSNVNPLDYDTKATYDECITMVSAMETIDAGNEQHGRWISVEDRLPETQAEVLLYVKHNNGGTNFVSVGSRSHFTHNRYYIDAVTTAIDADRVTHWRPLPEPPKDAEK